MSEIAAYQNESLSFEERARDIVSRMTLEEKCTQMIFNSPAIDRLCIPAYNWWNEALHGVARAGVATVFPQAIGLAAAFDEKMIYEVADIISTEGRAKYHESSKKDDRDIYKGLTFWSPNINIFRDPRWGRGHETYGEDPYLTGRLGVAFVKGLQGNDKKYMKSAACAKHYAVHSGPESLRHSFDAEVSEKDLRETYLPAFRDLVKEAGVEGVMGAYNRTNGEPCCGSKKLLRDILLGEWNFKGYVTSDCWAIKDFHENHMVTRTAPESVALAVKNGCNLNCGNMYLNLMIAYNEGLIAEEEINESVYRLMLTRMKLGFFDKEDNNAYTKIDYSVVDCKEHRAFNLEVSKKTMVLLKNKNNILPLDKKSIHSIAVIGPNANNRQALIGNYYGTASRYTTVLEGIQNATSDDIRVYYAEGCHLFKNKLQGLETIDELFAEAVSAAEHADVVVMCLGLDASIEGEEGDTSNEFSAGDKKDLNLPGRQQKLLEKIQSTGKPIILVNLSGSAIALKWADDNVDAIVQAWYPGAEGGTAFASLLFGEYSPSGRLPITFYNTTEELPDFCDYSMKDRTYRYMKNEALYPFGYGLSYTRFKYSNLLFEHSSIPAGENQNVSVTVKNTGSVFSDEIVQLYIRDTEASVEIPKWTLVSFNRVTLSPGKEKTLSFVITPKHMSLINNSGERILEEGSFEVYAGGSQPDARSRKLTGTEVLCGTFTVTGHNLKLDY